MELHFSTFLATIRINVFDSNNLGFVLYDLDKSIDLVYAHYINEFLRKELRESWVDFIIEFRVFGGKLFHLCDKLMNEMFGSGILNGDLDSFDNFLLDFNKSRSVDCDTGSVFSECLQDVFIVFYVKSRILLSEVVDLFFVYLTCVL